MHVYPILVGMEERVSRQVPVVSCACVPLVLKVSVVKFVSLSTASRELFEHEICILAADNCRPNPCQNNGVCTSVGTSFTCSCISGFSGQRCEIRSYFSPFADQLSRPLDVFKVMFAYRTLASTRVNAVTLLLVVLPVTVYNRSLGNDVKIVSSVHFEDGNGDSS